MTFKCLYPAPDLGPACSDAFLSQGSKFPWEVVLAESLGHPSPNKAEQFLFGQQWDPKPSTPLGLSADGPTQRGSSQSHPQNVTHLLQTCQKRQENKV